jgi:hypothetical protein
MGMLVLGEFWGCYVRCGGVSVSGLRLYAGGAATPTVPHLFTFCLRYVLVMLASFTICSCSVFAGKLSNRTSLTITSLSITTVKLAIVVLVIVKLIDLL